MIERRPIWLRQWTALLAWLACAALTAWPAGGQQQPGPNNADSLASNGNAGLAIEASGVADGPASANDARLRALEEQLRKLLEEGDKNQNDASQPSFEMGGMIQVDFLLIGQNTANRASVGDADNVFDFRRARFTAEGQTHDVVEYAIGFDFALAGRPSFLNNFIAVGELPVLGNVRVGHYFEPFSLERFTVVRYTTFMERSLADTFAPARNLGVMAHNTIGEDDRGTWAVGWFRTNSDIFGDNFLDFGGNAVTTRRTWLPYYDFDAGGRTLVHLGAAYTYRSEDRRRIQFASFPEARAGSPAAAGIPMFVDTGFIPAHSDQRAGVEAALVYGPLYVQGEYIHTTVDQIGGPALVFRGAYAFVSYFLTGENRTYNQEEGTFDRVYPFENFFRVRTEDGTATGRGAWEVAARWSYIDLDSHNVRGGRLQNVTLALNWHLNPHTRVKWEYIYAQLDRAPVGQSFAQIAGMRFDIDF